VAERSARVAVIGGDGIGPEVVDACIPAVAAAAGHDGLHISWERLPYSADHYLETGETLPDSAFDHLANAVDAILLGALGDSRVPGNEHARDILLGLRFRLDLYINFRPCRLLHPDLCPLKPGPDGARAIDFVIFRENTEGSYLGRGSSKHEGTPDEEQIAEEVHTARKVERLLRAAFTWAKEHGRSLVTVSDKSNAIPAHRIWRRIAQRVAADFDGVALEFRYVDALAMELVREPERFQVIAANNLFGDILSDLGAQLVGGLGVAASANLHPGRPGLFEPVHGSAPPLVGTGRANPFGAIMTGVLMLEQLRAPRGAAALERAVRAAIDRGATSPDLGGSLTTAQVAEAVTEDVRAVAETA
jgi:3-isopropylmalate dehydrogenase